jgi:hypothetical protein
MRTLSECLAARLENGHTLETSVPELHQRVGRPRALEAVHDHILLRFDAHFLRKQRRKV